MNTTLSVNAIQHGTVIDHITAGQALRIVHLLSLNATVHQVTIGLNLQSKSMGKKDLIKISGRALTSDEANDIVVFSPHVTINIIQNFEVSEKIKTHLPSSIRGVFVCLNPNCITHTESVDSYFYINQGNKDMKLTCHYCDRQFGRDQVRVKI